MCGIAGIVGSRQSQDNDDALIRSMLEIQHHRGPDSTGVWSADGVRLGHNRLAIIDLSDAANQPMIHDGLVLIFNGEIYNYVEIRKELEFLGHRFCTSSDSEVILHAFQQWGGGCVNRFMGMWAFVIWDDIQKRFFASRDRFGIKPFNYIVKDGVLHFASELKTLKVSNLFQPILNLNQVSRGIQLGWLCYEDETYFDVIKSLPAAHNLEWYQGHIKTYKYWDVNGFDKSNLSFAEKVDRFREHFMDSIRFHLRSDVPIASCLSGGIDSSSIVSSVQKITPDVKYKTFSIYYEGKGDVDERSFVSEVIGKYPNIQPYYFSPSDDDVRDCFDHALFHCDVPATGSSFISQYFLMRMISKHGIKVVLDGQGADEYLGGYMHTYYRLIGGMLRAFDLVGAYQATSIVNSNLGNGVVKKLSHFGKSIVSGFSKEQSVYGLEYNRYFPFMMREKPAKNPFELKDCGATKVDGFLYNLLFTTSLPSLLHYEDRNSMAFSIESRVPFLDHRLVEYAFALSDDDRITPSTTKRVLREAMRGIIPDAIFNRKDKKGFVTPGESKWLRGPLSHLLDNIGEFPDFIDRKPLNKVLGDYKNGDNSKAILVWRLAVLNHWMKSI
ncbi:MAG: asparagine synthase (glutamine-hydrolyzing) [Bacteroidota bacterium]|jgi:asparagine synthase (glutamine-hydrolysing)